MVDVVESRTGRFRPKPALNLKALKPQNMANELVKRLEQNKDEAAELKMKHKLSRKDYPELVELKLSGKSEEEIARKLGVRKQEVKIHGSKAMADFRAGRIKINAGRPIMEAQEEGAAQAAEATNTISGTNNNSSAPSLTLIA